MPISSARVRDRIPKTHPVQPLPPGVYHSRDVATCGTCHLSWDDSVSTALTPTPAGRCPFEAFHRPAPKGPKGTTPVAVGARVDGALVAPETLSHYSPRIHSPTACGFVLRDGQVPYETRDWRYVDCAACLAKRPNRARRVLCLTIDVPEAMAPAELVDAAGDALTARGFTFVGGYVEPEKEDERSHVDGAIKLRPELRDSLVALYKTDRTFFVRDQVPALIWRDCFELARLGLLRESPGAGSFTWTEQGVEAARTIGAS